MYYNPVQTAFNMPYLNLPGVPNLQGLQIPNVPGRQGATATGPRSGFARAMARDPRTPSTQPTQQYSGPAQETIPRSLPAQETVGGARRQQRPQFGVYNPSTQMPPSDILVGAIRRALGLGAEEVA